LTVHEIDLPYGSKTCRVSIPAQRHVDVISPLPQTAAADPEVIVAAALDTPLAGYSLEQFRGAGSAAIAINDKTRPVLHSILLPALLERLERTGIPSDQIELIVATGTHLPSSAQEILHTYPSEIVHKYRISSHDCDDAGNLIHLGSTSRGTPVSVNKRFLEADVRIVTGNIEPHHFMGFSGGVKSAAIGLAGRHTINTNHAMLVDPQAKAGLYDENPMRMDIEEIGNMMGIHFALNTIQNDDLEIIHALAGHPKKVMEAGIPLSRQACQVAVDGLYDLVIASAGGYPKDINLYQSQKALTHAAMITRDGGWIIVAAECREGSGSRSCEAFLSDIKNLEEVFAKFRREGFRVGPHKAFQIAREAGRVNLILVSDLPDELARKFFFMPFAGMPQALETALAALPQMARIAVMPSATHTIPYNPGGSQRESTHSLV
jgi:lactate racemase